MKKVADILGENVDVSRNQGVCHVTYVISGSSLGKV